MKIKTYKVEIFRVNLNSLASSDLLQKFINDFAKEGWLVNTILFLEHLNAYQIFLEKEM